MRRLLLSSLAAVLLGACLGAPPTPPPTAQPTAAPTPGMTTGPGADWPPVPDDDVEGLPPIARLVLADGTVAAGRLGSFSYDGLSADSPWLSSGLEWLEPPDRQELTAGLLPGHAFDEWRVSYAAVADTTGSQVVTLDSGSGDGLTRASFAPPPAGDWVVQLGLTFPDEAGDAVYYWRVSVP
jgi:hypothetical protein